MADRQGQEKEEQVDVYNISQGAIGAYTNLLSGKVGDDLRTEDR